MRPCCYKTGNVEHVEEVWKLFDWGKDCAFDDSKVFSQRAMGQTRAALLEPLSGQRHELR